MPVKFGKKPIASTTVEPAKPSTSVPVSRTPHKKKEKYRSVERNDLFKLIYDAIKGKIKINDKLRHRMKKGYPYQPFGGEMTSAGGWNSITYAIAEVIEESERFYVKKDD